MLGKKIKALFLKYLMYLLRFSKLASDPIPTSQRYKSVQPIVYQTGANRYQKKNEWIGKEKKKEREEERGKGKSEGGGDAGGGHRGHRDD